ncbi:uncharacterized protein LOC111260358 isoform X3 [Varroa jacobsoni]|uniref:uncharacterized protein LOC111260358 isoform X3 n=1 Tax=Varroa jacobsoni TaxID=62625 RepID=UPI000BF459FD|nr:uncharacterized protein LOC111260358 isoform X3 [Varroa jacobsoni]
MSFQKCLTLAFQRNFTTSTRRPTLVTCEDVGGIRMIGINRPEKKNSVNADTADELFSQFERFDADASVNVAVLFGNGGTFCAGYDLEEISRTDKTLLDRFKRRSPMGPCGMLTNKPIVAAIQGYAVAGGFELALWCDLRVVEETAVMGVFCRRFGMPLLNGGTVRLPQLIGLSRTMDLILTAFIGFQDEPWTEKKPIRLVWPIAWLDAVRGSVRLYNWQPKLKSSRKNV